MRGEWAICASVKRLAPCSPPLWRSFTPFCGFPNKARRRPWSFHGPLLLVTAEHDNMGAAAKCLPIIDRARGNLSGVESVDFPGMTHAFDEQVQSPDSRFIYDAEAAGQAQELFSSFVTQQVARLRAPKGLQR